MDPIDNRSGLCRRLVLLEEQLKLADQRRPIVEEARKLRREQRRTKLRGIGNQIGAAMGKTKEGARDTAVWQTGK